MNKPLKNIIFLTKSTNAIDDKSNDEYVIQHEKYKNIVIMFFLEKVVIYDVLSKNIFEMNIDIKIHNLNNCISDSGRIKINMYLSDNHIIFYELFTRFDNSENILFDEKFTLYSCETNTIHTYFAQKNEQGKKYGMREFTNGDFDYTYDLYEFNQIIQLDKEKYALIFNVKSEINSHKIQSPVSDDLSPTRKGYSITDFTISQPIKIVPFNNYTLWHKSTNGNQIVYFNNGKFHKIKNDIESQIEHLSFLWNL